MQSSIPHFGRLRASDINRVKRLISRDSLKHTRPVRLLVFCSVAMASEPEWKKVLDYWFGGGDPSKRAKWFGAGEKGDQEIRERFNDLVSKSNLTGGRNVGVTGVHGTP